MDPYHRGHVADAASETLLLAVVQLMVPCIATAAKNTTSNACAVPGTLPNLDPKWETIAGPGTQVAMTISAQDLDT